MSMLIEGDTYTVTDVIRAAGQLPRVNVSTGGADGIPGVICPEWYQPQRGDSVLVLNLGGPRCVAHCFTPGRMVVPASVTVTDATPSLTDFSQISTVYSRKGVLASPDLVLVRSAPPTPPSGGTATVPATASRSWNDQYGWRADNNRAYQGNYGAGNHKGLWFYGTAVATALSGKTVTAGRLTVVRAGSGGSFGNVQLRLWLHAYGTQPAGEPALSDGPQLITDANPSINATAAFALPPSWITALQAGTATGVGIYATTQADYSILLGPDENAVSGLLAFDYA